MVEIIRKATPQTLDEIERSFKPIEYREGDYSGAECAGFGFPVGLLGRFRVGVVFAVDREDANKITHIAKILGPATGGQNLTIPMGGNVEWAWVQEAIEWRQSTMAQRAIDRALRVKDLQDAFNKQLPDVADNMMKQKAGKSTFGHGGKLQRIS